jgi:hypothetical protein
VKQLANGGSLIPEGSTYKDQLKAFRAECKRVGINGVHGLRHRYAQERYFEKTGWPCPARGGPTAKKLTPEQRSIDERVRLEISLELGHGRGQVTGLLRCGALQAPRGGEPRLRIGSAPARARRAAAAFGGLDSRKIHARRRARK